MLLFLLLRNVVVFIEAANLSERDDDKDRVPNLVPSSSYTHNLETPPTIKKKKRSLPGNPDPNSEVIALSPESLLATNRFTCEICQRGFQREQNLQLHKRGHNLPWKLKQVNSNENRKKVYTCPEPTCVHHHPSRALGDMTGIKKHFARKHGVKQWRCEKCSKLYAVESDWKVHTKRCLTRDYKCHCGIKYFSRKDNFNMHIPSCAALGQESASLSANILNHQMLPPPFSFATPPHQPYLSSPTENLMPMRDPLSTSPSSFPEFLPTVPSYSHPELSATALLEKAASIGSFPEDHVGSTMAGSAMPSHSLVGLELDELTMWYKEDHMTRDFIGLIRKNGGDANAGFKELPTFSRMLKDEHNLFKMNGEDGAEFLFGDDQTWT